MIAPDGAAGQGSALEERGGLTKTTVGFVGLGQMGGNMAARLHSAGYEVYGNEREHALALEEAGRRWRDTLREVIKRP
jgi:3-hydroxyisobutyrate dehydrogenase-like beta-hydroxyacid dehydrogenase